MPEDTGEWYLGGSLLPLSLVTASTLRTLLHILLEQIKKHFQFLAQIHLTVATPSFTYREHIDVKQETEESRYQLVSVKEPLTAVSF